MIKKVRKRDGRLVDFNKEKISNAIFKSAQDVGGTDRQIAERLAEEVSDLLDKTFKNKVPSVEDVQDAVEKVLIEEGHAKTAKNYILYRQQKANLRETKELIVDSIKLVDDYIGKEDWRVYENANATYSLPGLMWYASGTIMTFYGLHHVYPKEISNAHLSGHIHLHNLTMALNGYCAGWDLRKLLHEGFNGIPGRIECRPAKHLRTAIGQMINFIGTVQNEWAGAQAFNSFDTYLAPFVRQDKLTEKEVKQCIQEYIYNMNIPSRWAGQCVSEDTEALTENGWKKYNEISSEKIATFNINKNKIEYLIPERVMAYDYNGYLVRLKNRTQEQLLTPDHKVVRKKFNSSKFEFIEAQKLSGFKTPVLIPLASETESKLEINDNLIKLYAWLVSEGSFSSSRRRIDIYQSEKNKDKCDEIRKILSDLNYKWDEQKRVSGFSKNFCITFRLNQETSRKIRKTINSKKIPLIIKKLSKRQIKLFIDNYVKGDGFIEPNGRIRIVTKDKEVRDSIQELCSLCGYGSTTSLRKENNVWQINIIRNPLASITKIDWVKYKGKVWCPTTRNGTFIARRNGKVFITGNTPFTNITLDLTVPEDLKEQKVTVGGKLLDSTYADYQDEIELINKVLIQALTEGDAKGRVFTFPIPTYNLTKDFKWDSELANLLFEMTAKYGLPYFQNFINSDLNPSDIRAMCCRLQLNLKELQKNITGGRFSSAESTGSIGVATINLPRLAYESKSQEEFFEKLERYMYIAKESLEIKRKIVERNIQRNLLPYTKRYLGTLKNHFSTIGIIGMHEACLNLFNKGIETEEGRQFAIQVLNFMRDKILEYQQETGHIYNLEATPGEGASYRLAMKDKKEDSKIITAGTKEPYYTNSTQLPVGYTNDILTAIRHQEPLQKLYTGGTVFHTFLGESIDKDACKLLVKKIASNSTLPYFTITPTFSICEEHGYLKDEQAICPKCRKPTEVYSRVVGYFRPVRDWNLGKQEEFKERKVFKPELKV